VMLTPVALVAQRAIVMQHPWSITLGLATIALTCVGSGWAYIIAGQVAIGREVRHAISLLPRVTLVAFGVTLHNARGVIEAMVGHRSPFVRTPKECLAAPRREALGTVSATERASLRGAAKR